MSKQQNPQKVYDFLKNNASRFFCDDCVDKGVGVDRHEVNTIGRTLALFPKEFTRISTECSKGCSNRDKDCTKAL
jgi:hypothetical protein